MKFTDDVLLCSYSCSMCSTCLYRRLSGSDYLKVALNSSRTSIDVESLTSLASDCSVPAVEHSSSLASASPGLASSTGGSVSDSALRSSFSFCCKLPSSFYSSLWSSLSLSSLSVSTARCLACSVAHTTHSMGCFLNHATTFFFGFLSLLKW